MSIQTAPITSTGPRAPVFAGGPAGPPEHDADEVRTEDPRAAVGIATGWAIATRRPGVVRLGRAELPDALGALAEAHGSGIPLVCVTAAAGLRRELRDAAGALTAGWLEPVTPASALDVAIERAADRGVVLLDVDGHARGEGAVGEAPEAAVSARAEAALSTARHPVLVAGSGCWFAGAAAALRALAERARIPVVPAGAARGMIPDHHDLCVVPGGSDGSTHAALAGADVVVLAGTDAVPFGARAERRVLRLGSLEGLTASLGELARGARPLPTQPWVEELRAAVEADRAAHRPAGRNGASPIPPARALAEIANALPTGVVVCVDEGLLAGPACQLLSATEPGAVLRTPAGMGLPWAIGAKIARPQRPVLVVAGAAAIERTAMQMTTAARQGAAVAVLITSADDGSAHPGFEALGEVCGGVGDRVETPEQLGIALTNAFVARVPSVIHAVIDHPPAGAELPR